MKWILVKPHSVAELSFFFMIHNRRIHEILGLKYDEYSLQLRHVDLSAKAVPVNSRRLAILVETGTCCVSSTCASVSSVVGSQADATWPSWKKTYTKKPSLAHEVWVAVTEWMLPAFCILFYKSLKLLLHAFLPKGQTVVFKYNVAR